MPKVKGPILQLTVTSPTTSCTIVIPHSFSFWNLHRVIQIALNAKAMEATIEKMTYQVSQGETVPKKGKMIKIDSFTLAEGDSFEYVCAGTMFTVQVQTKIDEGDILNYIPRCIAAADGENVDLNAINTKLLLKRFGMNPTNNKKPRQPPKMVVMVGESDQSIWQTYYNAMRMPAAPYEDFLLAD
ncbi:hypothetical protein DFJ77DRAFT_459086 [Powellomyces hirtus]|nr:hypothetical protein DFJ77DRAFT_459086 [Powellomyces hirtus]